MNIVDPLHQHALTTPSGTALILPSGRVSWRQLDKLIWRSANQLRDQGVKHSDLVALAFENPLLHLITALGLAKIGAIQIALPTSDTSIVREQTSRFLGIDTVITDRPDTESLQVRIIGLTQLPKPLNDSGKNVEGFSTEKEDTWLLIQSSGTTGEPKYAQLSHRISLERFARWSDAYQYRQGDVFWIGLGLNTITGKQHTVSALQAGIAVCMATGFKAPVELMNFVKSSGTTLAYDIPSHLWELVNLYDGSLILPRVRKFVSGTTHTSDNLRNQFTKKVTPNLYINYGSNEAPCVTVSSPQLDKRVKGTVGIAHHQLKLQIVDDEDRPVSQGTTGRIRISGPGIICEYYRNSEDTHKAFKDGWFYPGDLAYLTQEDAVILQGRTDEMLIYDGMNIYPSEIERVLCAHPLISEAIAFSIKHQGFEDVPAAAVIPTSKIDQQELIDWTVSHLGVKSPRRLFIVKEFPKSKSGKILRRELSKQF